MYRDQAFQILGLSITSDKKKIKKAYAALVKQYHPEEFPDEWKRLHEAYEVALQYAKANNKVNQELQVSSLKEEIVKQEAEQKYQEEQQHLEEERRREEEEKQRKEEEKQREEEEYLRVQKQYEELFAQGKQQAKQWEKEKIGILKTRMYRLQDKKRIKYQEWYELFDSPEFQEFCHTPETIQLLRYAIRGKKLNKKSRELIQKTVEQINWKTDNRQLNRECNAVLDILRKDAMNDKFWKMSPKKFWKNVGKGWLFVIIILIFMSLRTIAYIGGHGNGFGSLNKKEEEERQELINAYLENKEEVNMDVLNQLEERRKEAEEQVHAYRRGAYQLEDGIYINQTSGDFQLSNPDESFMTTIPEGMAIEQELNEQLPSNASVEMILYYQTPQEITDGNLVWIIDKDICNLEDKTISSYYVWQNDEWEVQHISNGMFGYIEDETGIEDNDYLCLISPVPKNGPAICTLVLYEDEAE